MSVTNPSDYIGKFEISKNPTNIIPLQNLIDEIELTTFNQLFGIDLYDLYLQGIENEDELYLKLFNPFFLEYNDKLYESKGIVEMMKGFVYYANFVYTTVHASTNGNVISDSENSRKATDTESNIYVRHNESVKTFKAIQLFCEVNKTDYPTFKGVKKQLITWF